VRIGCSGFDTIGNNQALDFIHVAERAFSIVSILSQTFVLRFFINQLNFVVATRADRIATADLAPPNKRWGFFQSQLPIEIGSHVLATATASLADKLLFEIRQPGIIRPLSPLIAIEWLQR
jgi:hypothetical protein